MSPVTHICHMEFMEYDVFVVSIAVVRTASCPVPQPSRVQPPLSDVAFLVVKVHQPSVVVLPVVVLTSRTLLTTVPDLLVEELGPATAVLFLILAVLNCHHSNPHRRWHHQFELCPRFFENVTDQRVSRTRNPLSSTTYDKGPVRRRTSPF